RIRPAKIRQPRQTRANRLLKSFWFSSFRARRTGGGDQMEAPDRKTVRIGDLEVRFLVDEAESAGKVVMFEFVVPSKARVPAPHHHRDVDEVVYGLEGTLTTTVDGQKRPIAAGETVFIPRGSVHYHENV